MVSDSVKGPENLVCRYGTLVAQSASTGLSSPAKKRGMDRSYVILERQSESGGRARAYAKDLLGLHAQRIISRVAG